mmetsp:Transcript_63275/g.137624  ORF Transcript_63275/g.137624 Transcript_63275/m.137624 type:complete len:101 (+) Transcript_63275:168-470(+)
MTMWVQVATSSGSILCVHSPIVGEGSFWDVFTLDCTSMVPHFMAPVSHRQEFGLRNRVSQHLKVPVWSLFFQLLYTTQEGHTNPEEYLPPQKLRADEVAS